mgnify:CR=1 FL=1|tara:strand:- start:282 stop:467 length:186 start_codon:yes stop_codon:yes gene_type:complete
MAREKDRFLDERKQKLDEYRWQKLTLFEIVEYLDTYYKKKYIVLLNEFIKKHQPEQQEDGE